MLLYNMPGMLALGTELIGYQGTLRGIGENINRIAQDISIIWEGQSSLNYQAWQAQFLLNMERLNASLSTMASTFMTNAVTMNTVDATFATSWA